MNNPNKPRRQKRFFASDFLKVSKEDVENNMKDGFTIHDALKLNVVRDEETEAKKPVKPRAPRVAKEPVPIAQREKSTRVRKPNSMLRDFVETPEMPEMSETPEMPQPSQDGEPLKLSISKALWKDGLQRKEKKKQPRKEPVPIIQREKSTRIRKPNSMLKDFVGGELPATSYVILGGTKHFLI